jgi:tRNA pseudouridine55 synthase
MATGVLVVCVGGATRLARFLAAGTKEYSGEIVLGVVTDTYDAEGAVVRRLPAEGIGLEELRRAAARFVGDIEQTPPAWSAKKVRGRRSYELARSGAAPEPAACRVRVEAFDVLEARGDRCSFRVVCSGGTYIRSLAHDLGAALGCGAHLGALRRTRSGVFTAAEAAPLDAIEEDGRNGAITRRLIRPDDLDLGLAAVRLTEAGLRLAAAGSRVPASEGYPLDRAGAGTARTGAGGGSWVRLLSPDGRLVALAQPGEEPAGGYRPRVVLPPARPLQAGGEEV